MNNDQQYALGTYLNLMLSATQLIINPIDGLKPFYSDEDFESYVYSWDEINEKLEVVIQKKRKEGKKTRRYESYIQPKYTDKDYERYLSIMFREGYPNDYIQNKTAVVFLANLLTPLYDICDVLNVRWHWYGSASCWW